MGKMMASIQQPGGVGNFRLLQGPLEGDCRELVVFRDEGNHMDNGIETRVVQAFEGY